MRRVPRHSLPVSLRSSLAIAASLGCLVSGVGPALAVDIPASTFFADCSLPIYIAEDTVVVGKADIEGNCLVSVNTGFSFGLSKAKLTFTEGFRVHGNAAAVTVDKSKVTVEGATGLVLDSRGSVTVTSSTLVAETGPINMPPGDALSVTNSTVSAGTSLTFGGTGGLRTITNGKLSAGESITFASGCPSLTGVPSAISIVGGSLASAGTITLGGCATQNLDGTSLEALGTGTAITISGYASVPRTITDTRVEAPLGSIIVTGGGGASVTITDSQFTSDAASVEPAAITLGLAGLTVTRSRFRATQGYISTVGFGDHLFEDCQFDAAGASSDGYGIYLGNGGAKTFTAGSLRARGGSVRLVGNGPIAFTDTKVRADGMDGNLVGITISGGGVSRTIEGSQFRSALGLIRVEGSGNTSIEGSKLLAKNDQGILLSNAGTATVNASSLSTKLGGIRIPNGGSVDITGSKITAGGASGFVVESGFSATHSLLDASKVKGAQVAIRSFVDTTVTGNSLKVGGVIEFSSAGTCTSLDNNPDVACF